MKSLRRTTGPGRRAAFMLAAAALCACVGSAGAARKHLPRISIILRSPTRGTVVPRYGASPVFRWRIVDRGAKPLKGSGRLEVSTTRSFVQEAVLSFDCGYDPGDCPTHYHWNNQRPHWYDEANSCSDIPPVGHCGTLSRVLYWRVRFEPVGGRSYSSHIGVLRRAVSTDTTPPTAKAQPGSSAYGEPGRVYFSGADDGGTVRDEVELYDGSKVVFGARTDWVSDSGPGGTYMDLPFPPSIKPGRYRWCLTVVDQADNSATDCAAYTIS